MMKTYLTRALGIALLALTTSCATPTGSGDVIPYTSSICIVTDNKLGSMGDPVVKVYGNQEVKFCCRPCGKKWEPRKSRAR